MLRVPETDEIILGENLDVLAGFAEETFQMIYIDPPFNTGKEQLRKTLQTVPDAQGDRTGFKGQRYKTKLLAESSYRDIFDAYLEFRPAAAGSASASKANGTLYFQSIPARRTTARSAGRILAGELPQRDHLGLRLWGSFKARWPAKHDTILVYVKDTQAYHFRSDEVDREPYMAPGLVTPRSREGQTPD